MYGRITLALVAAVGGYALSVGAWIALGFAVVLALGFVVDEEFLGLDPDRRTR